MLADNVTPNVTQIRIVGYDAEENEVSNTLVPRQEAEMFSVPASWPKVDMRLITAENEQIGKIIFDPEGTDMTLTLPGADQTPYQVLKQDIVINADMWQEDLAFMAGGLGFSYIIGMDGIDLTDLEASRIPVLENQGAWMTLEGCGETVPSIGNYTTATSPAMVESIWGPPAVSNAGGMPLEFAYPFLLSTVEGSDFRIWLNDGTSVLADVAGFSPNSDYNERSCVVLFGQFGNRLELDDPGVLYPKEIEVVGDVTLIGPGGELFPGKGLRVKAPGSPYKTPGNGPLLTRAKLTVMSAVGDGGPPGFTNYTPNDGIAIYGDDAQYRLRLFTTGGYTKDGVLGLKPTEYDTSFIVQVRNAANELVPLTKANTPYVIDGYNIEVLGLAELGAPGQVVDGNDCYGEDKDNQIDIVIKGDIEIVSKIELVDIPSNRDGYTPFYNPGGPGNTVWPGYDITYTQGSPDHWVLVTNALQDPMAVTYIDLRQADDPPTAGGE